MDAPPPLTAPYRLEYTYHRSTGPVIGRFLAGLRDGILLGAKTTSGRVVVPPTEWDPIDGAGVAELVHVADRGVVTGFTWVETPRPSHPRKHPFAFVLVRLDGADTAMVHVGDFASRADVHVGRRVRARFADQRVGAITDLLGFVPEEST